MLCVARCNLSDWPMDQIRDVDPEHEQIAGFLRQGFIVPVRIPRRDAEAEPTRTTAKSKRSKDDE
jgi:hypothetical protein